MNQERFDQLRLGVGSLTAEEKHEWHFCWDWDGLLIHKDDLEFECCVCQQGDEIRAGTR